MPSGSDYYFLPVSVDRRVRGGGSEKLDQHLRNFKINTSYIYESKSFLIGKSPDAPCIYLSVFIVLQPMIRIYLDDCRRCYLGFSLKL